MKLLTQATLYYLLITLVVFGLGGMLTYHIVRSNIVEETDYHLRHSVRHTFQAIERGAPVEALTRKYLHLEEIDTANVAAFKPVFRDTLIWHKHSKQMEPFRMVHARKQIGKTAYEIMLIEVIVETSDVYKSVLRSLSWTYFLQVIVMAICSFFFSKWLFKPFKHTLSEIRRFRIQDQARIDLGPTSTKEFTQLNAFVSRMTGKGQQDYLSLKEFSENASHEMQTPIAVAKGKLELLLENNDLTEEQGQLVLSSYNSLIKLSKLGRSLALLTRIENQEFADLRLVNFSDLLSDTLFNFQELMELKDLTVTPSLIQDIQLHIDPTLADMLLTNLFQNAIRHNVQGGSIDVQLETNRLCIRNSGESPQVPLESLFGRFRKNSNSSESLGLGLAIVKKICDVSKLEIQFGYQENMYEMEIKW